jgi:tRNA G18 (ribose-2'-O)-methylase SpoU
MSEDTPDYIVDLKTNYNVRDDLKNLPLEELQKIQASAMLPFAICAFNVAGSLNIGTMIRTAILMGAEKFIVFGRRAYDRRSCVGAQNYIPIERYEGYNDDGTFSKEKFDDVMHMLNYIPVFIETGGKSINDIDYVKDFKKKPCLVFGTEADGIPEEIIGNGMRVSVPQLGVMRSLNVATAAAIVTWEFRKFYSSIYGKDYYENL